MHMDAVLKTVVCVHTVDHNEYGVLPPSMSLMEMKGEAYMKDGELKRTSNGAPAPTDGTNGIVEHKPHFFEWATATVGMLAVQRRMRTTFRGNAAAEAAAPVVVCAAGRGKNDELDFQFAGVVRSNSVRTMDDGVGPTTDEYFTLTIGGLMTVLNNSSGPIHPGDYVSWTFYSDNSEATRRTHGAPRRIGLNPADLCVHPPPPHSVHTSARSRTHTGTRPLTMLIYCSSDGSHDENVIGKAMTFAKVGRHPRHFKLT